MARYSRAILVLALVLTVAACQHPSTSIYLVNMDSEPYYVTLDVSDGLDSLTDFVVLPGEKGLIFSDTGDYASEVTLRGTDCVDLEHVGLQPGRTLLTISAGRLEAARDVNLAEFPPGFLSEASDCVGI